MLVHNFINPPSSFPVPLFNLGRYTGIGAGGEGLFPSPGAGLGGQGSSPCVNQPHIVGDWAEMYEQYLGCGFLYLS